MKWLRIFFPLLNEPLEDRLVLSKKEAAALKRAAEVLADIRARLEKAYGEDELIDLNATEPWVLAESYLYAAIEELICEGTTIKLPLAEREQ